MLGGKLRPHLRVDFGFGIALMSDRAILPPAFAASGLRAIRNRATQLFGGCTVTATEGDWRSPQGDIHTEAGRTLSVLVPADFPGNIGAAIEDVADFIRVALQQEAVYVSVAEVLAGLL